MECNKYHMTQNAFFEKQLCLICLIHLRMATHWACRNIIIYFRCHGMLTNIKLDLCLLLSYLCEPNINALCHHWLALKKCCYSPLFIISSNIWTERAFMKSRIIYYVYQTHFLTWYIGHMVFLSVWCRVSSPALITLQSNGKQLSWH